MKKHLSKFHKNKHMRQTTGHTRSHDRNKDRPNEGYPHTKESERSGFPMKSYVNSAGIMSIPELEGYVLEEYQEENENLNANSKY